MTDDGSGLLERALEYGRDHGWLIAVFALAGLALLAALAWVVRRGGSDDDEEPEAQVELDPAAEVDVDP